MTETTTPRKWRDSTKAIGETVFDQIAIADIEGKSLQQLVDETGYTRAQIHLGLRYIRELFAGEKSEPFAYDYRTNTYHFAADREEAVDYLRRRIKILNKWIANLVSGTADPAYLKFGHYELEQVKVSLERASEDLERLLTSLTK